jgi:hypothetical protein
MQHHGSFWMRDEWLYTEKNLHKHWLYTGTHSCLQNAAIVSMTRYIPIMLQYTVGRSVRTVYTMSSGSSFPAALVQEENWLQSTFW